MKNKRASVTVEHPSRPGERLNLTFSTEELAWAFYVDCGGTGLQPLLPNAEPHKVYGPKDGAAALDDALSFFNVRAAS